jgi:hypothetical protein
MIMDRDDATAAYTAATVAYSTARQLIEQINHAISVAREPALDNVAWRNAASHLEAARGFVLQAQTDAFDAEVKAGDMLAQSA